jgi:hypothetical protein
MLNWLLRLWQRLSAWARPHPAPKDYRPSNLHGRYR